MRISGRIKVKQHMGEVLDAVTAAKYFAPHAPTAEVGALVREVTHANASVVAAAHGDISVDTTILPDALTGQSFVSLFVGPAILTKPVVLKDSNRVSGPRTLENVPSFSGGGVTFTWWHKHSTAYACLEVDNQYCAVDLLSAFDENGVCWSFRLLEDGLFFENPRGADFTFKYSDPFMEQQHTLNSATVPVWRHVAITLDPSGDTVSYYLDGRRGWQGKWGSAVASADCAAGARSVAFGRKKPQWTFGLEVGVYDLRMYRHVVLSERQVMVLATADTSRVLGNADKCTVALGENSYYDKRWLDEHNRGCDWYQAHRAEVSTICTLPDPTRHCPVFVFEYLYICVHTSGVAR